MIKRLAFDGNITYLILDEKNKVATVIDPVLEQISDVKKEVEGFQVNWIIDTHSHADHFSGAEGLKKLVGGAIVMGQATPKQREFDTSLGKSFGIEDILEFNAKIPVDRLVSHYLTLPFGQSELLIFETPGHTLNSISVKFGHFLFTGDSLMMGQTGRLDLPGGSAETMFHTLNQVLKPLAKEPLFLCPGHDYQNYYASLLADEIANNPFFEPQTVAEFSVFTQQFFPPLTTENMSGATRIQCGSVGKATPAVATGSFENILPMALQEQLEKEKAKWWIVDVREPFELERNGKIDIAINIPLGQLPAMLDSIPLDKKVAVVCQSGGRSLQACQLLVQAGIPNLHNMTGGMTLWRMNFLPVA